MTASCSIDLEPRPIVTWNEDETFYSLCGRQHRVLGHLAPSQTLAWLFSSSNATTAHDFPNNLAALNDSARAAWGNPLSIILEHTILPLFFPFQSDQTQTEALQALCGPSLGSIKYRLGLLTSRFGAEHPLKACTSCMKADQDNSGVAYWHLSHQYPGVVVCPVHRDTLRESIHNRPWSGRFQWSLPSEGTLAPAQPLITPGENLEALEQMGKAVRELAACGARRQFNPHTAAALYQDALADGAQDLDQAFADHCALLQPYPPFTSLPLVKGQLPAFWARLLRPREGHSHPLKHLVAITCLHGSLSSFVEAYDRAAIRSPTKGLAPSNQITSEPRPANAPRHMNRDTVRRKPKMLKPCLRGEILDRLRRGEPKKGICDSCRITISTVNKLLRSEPDVRQSWLSQCQIAKIEEHRSTWIAAERQTPGSSPKEVRNLIPAAYAWLYRNDQAWLVARTQELASGRQGNHSKIDWAKRDEALLSLVGQKVAELQGAGLTASRTALFLACPGLAASLEKHGSYLRTRDFLKTMK